MICLALVQSVRWVWCALFFCIAVTSAIASEQPPPTPREFRAAWIATVANIDWPSRKNLTVAQLKQEADLIISRSKALGLNALILQVRPSADAIYPSTIEPWSEFLTGTQGVAPEDSDFDPLAYWVAQSHRAGLQLHAWFNPFRAWHIEATGVASSQHISRTRPDLVKAYDRFLWLDPGEPDATAHSLAVILDVVQRYDIDGVHFDDYFYPYPVKDTSGAVRDFPDTQSWAKYVVSGGALNRADWRRNQVNQFVQQVYEKTKAIKPWVRVGISPFGIGKPSLRPSSIKGFSQFDSLYADVEYWISQGHLDYLVPQLYFKLDQTGQAFSTLLQYWESQNPRQLHIWPGLFTSRTQPLPDRPQPWPVNEIIEQIKSIRERAEQNPIVSGQVHFSVKALMQLNSPLAQQVRQLYLQPALVPELVSAMTADSPIGLAAPNAKYIGSSTLLVSDEARQFAQIVHWQKMNATWHLSIQSAYACPCIISLAEHGQEQWISGVTRTGQESIKVHLP